LAYGDELVAGINTPRLHSLLAYLVLHRDAPQLRQHLAFLFWPDTSEAQARTNLRQILHQLRHTLPNADHYLSADASTVCWRPAALAAERPDRRGSLSGPDAAAGAEQRPGGRAARLPDLCDCLAARARRRAEPADARGVRESAASGFAGRAGAATPGHARGRA